MTTSTTGTEATSTGTQDVVSSIESLLTLPEDNQGDEATSDEANEQEGEEAPAGDEAPDDEQGTTDESDEDETEEPESDDDEQAEQAAQPRKFTVKIDGKDEQVEEGELVAGYSRTADYTRKTQALAKERSEFHGEKEAITRERAEYAALLPKLRQALEQGMGDEPDWQKLQAEDQANGTSRFANEWARWQQLKQSVDAVRAQEQEVGAKRQKEFEAQRESLYRDQQRQLLEKLPEWKDPAVIKKDSDAIVKLMKDVGYSDSELTIFDHRALIIARDAAAYRALMAQKPELSKKVAKAPVVKPSGGQRVEKTPAQAARKRFYQSGTVKDMAALIESVLD